MNLEIFKNEEFGNIGIVKHNGKEYFDANSVAKCLGYTRPNDIIRDKCKGTLESSTLKNNGGYPLKIIPEGDLYRLIISSQLPSVEKFERWMFDEVIPSIRKHGGYLIEKENDTPEEIMARALIVAQETLKRRGERIKALEIKAEEDEPLVTFANRVANTSDAIDIGTFSKLVNDENIDVGRNKLFDFLRSNKYLMKKNIPYQKYIDNGYFKTIEQVFKTPYGDKLNVKTLITGVGQIKIINKLKEEFGVILKEES